MQRVPEGGVNQQKQRNTVTKRHKCSRGEKPYKCKYCNKYFNTSLDCKVHTRIHTGEKPYQCKHCDNCFSRLSNCKRHERIHTGLKPYQCKYCDKQFSQSSACKRHERIHTGEKPFKCKYCDKRFTLASPCREHERFHTRVKPHKCKYCDKCFWRHLSACKRHERMHTGVKRRQCKHCDKWFSGLDHLNQHNRTHLGDTSLTYEDEAAHSGEIEPQLLSSTAEHTANQLNTFSCWICQEELSSQELLIEHYDNHMILE